MAEEQQDDVLDLTEDMQEGGGEDIQPEPEEEDLSFVIEDDDDDGLTDRPDDTEAIRRARAAARAQARRAAEAERQLRSMQQPTQAPPDPGDCPSIEDCEWDAERHAVAVTKWRDASVARARWDSEQEQARNRAQANEQRMVDDYRGKAAALGVKDFDAAHAAVVAAIPPETQALIGKYAKNSAQFVYALYKNPGVLARLAQQTDIAAQAVMIGELQRGMKMPAKRNAPPPPETDTIQRGTAPVGRVTADKKLAALEEKAEKTGDRSAVIAYKLAQKGAK